MRLTDQLPFCLSVCLCAGKGGFLNRTIMGWSLVKFDDVKQEPVRDSRGRCVPAKGRPIGDPSAFLGDSLAIFRRCSALSAFLSLFRLWCVV
jgi:hypothetical protein